MASSPQGSLAVPLARSRSHCRGAPPRRAAARAAVMRLAMSFTAPWEQSQLAAFVRAAVLASLLQEISSGDEAIRPQLAQWVEDEVTDERLSALYGDALVLRPTPCL